MLAKLVRREGQNLQFAVVFLVQLNELLVVVIGETTHAGHVGDEHSLALELGEIKVVAFKSL